MFNCFFKNVCMLQCLPITSTFKAKDCGLNFACGKISSSETPGHCSAI